MTPIDINFINLVIFWSKLINEFASERQKIFVFHVFECSLSFYTLTHTDNTNTKLQ